MVFLALLMSYDRYECRRLCFFWLDVVVGGGRRYVSDGKSEAHEVRSTLMARPMIYSST